MYEWRAGETVPDNHGLLLRDDLPAFMEELFSYSDLNPLLISEVDSFYTERNFEQIDSIDISNSLRSYYNHISNLSLENIERLSAKEKSYYKKYLNQINWTIFKICSIFYRKVFIIITVIIY